MNQNGQEMCKTKHRPTDRSCVYSITDGELRCINQGQRISLTMKEYNSEYGHVTRDEKDLILLCD